MTNGEASVEATDQPTASSASTFDTRAVGFVWAAVALMVFSGWFVVTRFSVTRALHVWDIAALRFGIGAVLLAPAILRPGTRLSIAAWGEGLVFALLWGLPFVLLVAFGLKLTSAAEAASIAPTLMPVFAGLFAWAFLRERQGTLRWVGYASIIVGLACLIAAGAAAHGAPSATGIAALVAAAAMWAVYTLLFRRSRMTPIQAAALICLWSAVLFLPAYLFLGLSRFSFASPAEIALQAIYQGVLMSVVALITFNRAVSLLGSSAATAIIALLPAVASILAVPVLGETASMTAWLSISVIVLGVVLAASPPHSSTTVSQLRRRRS